LINNILDYIEYITMTNNIALLPIT